MERMAWKGRIKPGCKEEYIKRHNEIWPEMVEVLKSAGICNYTIFAEGNYDDVRCNRHMWLLYMEGKKAKIKS